MNNDRDAIILILFIGIGVIVTIIGFGVLLGELWEHSKYF